MIISKNRIISFLIIIFAIILIDLIFYKIAMPADGAQIVIDENLRPGMKLKDAIEFLGSPETLTVSDAGTVIIPYNNHGLSIEVASQGSIIEKIHIYSGFKGRFLSGIEIGADFRQILSAYNQPDMMTKEVIEYSDGPRRFYINDGKLTGADLYSATSTLYNQIINKENVVKDNVSEATPEKVNMEVREEVREALREELRDEVREELREEVLDEVNKEIDEDFDAFDLFGFKVKQTSKGVIITEITPGSVAEKGGLITGEPVRKAFYQGAQKLNIYSVNGLESILKRSVLKRKKLINILQDRNYYYKIEVPKRK